ncbi:NAD-dependent epimerase/dehydratase family protein [Nonomuraea gerenzanensis]|uniref:NAD(P)H steroid dehydrogenase-like protein in alkane synthesis cluster n=1 Tax=Nonomuraea gerenzanensis TaxID=93944 RepID=A0A1M4EE14_9ACTN|nr:NAD-dependent epimerase/dehydratase family protein [Nonomuraea gerenzanensis]UBU08687.1 NAD-dependent epimerase/dehydratase family protein [Nonomuraea gerenzanensis]SBO97050.1 NAD(P)H steroid dehydrogenase-like protein in alkane synthesis cluster [Nonomuraea gerenzanensis]
MKVLVTGGGGFLGQAVCRLLAERGEQVSALNRRRYPALAELGVVQHAADIRDQDAVRAAVTGCEAVVHCAALAGLWGPASAYRSTNVRGTANVIDACLRAGVARLVHTSSPSVVHAGRDLEGVDESAPYARRFPAAYPASKAGAERLVLAADGDRLATVALRPHLVWGPGDPHFLPHLAAKARCGRLVLPHAPGKRVDTVYVDNAAEAHLLALDALTFGAPPAGRAYFITQGEPTTLADWIDGLLAAAGLPPVARRVPARPARLAATAVEYAYRLARVRAAPPITRMAAVQATTSHWFDISAARRDLGYEPRVSTAAGMGRLAAHLSGNTSRRP